MMLAVPQLLSVLALVLLPVGPGSRRAVAQTRTRTPCLVRAPRGRGAKRLSESTPSGLAKDKHLFFDEVAVSVRGGHGGNGAAFHLPRAGKGAKLKRTADGDFELPAGGGHGGRVVLEVDTSLQDLLHLHGRPLLAAPHGADSAGLNQYRKVQRQQREVSFLSNRPKPS